MSTFLSYSRADSSFALRLAKDLKSAGLTVWLDQLDIPTGMRWDDEVENALESCKIFMVILSPESLQSQNFKDEIGYAIDSGKDILPVRIKSGEIPFRLRRFQYVDFSKQSYPESLKEIKSLLSAMDNSPATREVEKDRSATEDQPTVKKIATVTPTHLPSEMKPTDHISEAAGSPASRKPIPKGVLIGIAAVAILAISGILLRTFAAARPSATASLGETSAGETLPSQQSTAEPTAEASPTPVSGESAQSAAFLTTFTGSSDLDSWEYSVTGTGRNNKASVEQSKDGLLFHINDPDLHAYYVYQPGNYGDAVIRMKAKNLGQNSYQVSLFCRKSNNRWYEFVVIGGGLWRFYEYDAEYILRVNGGTQALKPGNSVNEYEMRCIANEVTLLINGNEVATYSIKKNPVTRGQVGFSIASGTEVFPIEMKVIEFEVSN